MKSNKFAKKLKLNRKTIVKLDQVEMNGNKGGTSSYTSCVQSCGGTGSTTGSPISRIYRCTGLSQTCPGACG